MPQGNIHISFIEKATQEIPHHLFLKASVIDGVYIEIYAKVLNTSLGAQYGIIEIKLMDWRTISWLNIPVCTRNRRACADIVYFMTVRDEQEQLLDILRNMKPTYEEAIEEES